MSCNVIFKTAREIVDFEICLCTELIRSYEASKHRPNLHTGQENRAFSHNPRGSVSSQIDLKLIKNISTFTSFYILMKDMMSSS